MYWRASKGEFGRFRNRAKCLGLIAALTLLAACTSQPTYTIDHDEHTDFSRFKTYRWYDDTHDSKAADYRQYNSSDKRVRTYIDRELGHKGLKEISSGDADMWVNYNISKESRMKVDSFSGYSSPGMHGSVGAGSYGSAVSIGYSSGPSVREYKEGTVVLDIIDASSSKIVWRGIAEGRMQNSRSLNEKNHAASEVSRELLADYPPGKPSDAH